MGQLYQPTKSIAKSNEMHDYISGYWAQDIWSLKDDIFNEFRKTSSRVDIKYKRIKFGVFGSTLKPELKYFFKYRLTNKIVTIDTILKYGQTFTRLATFLNTYYPTLNSFSNLDLDKITIQLRTHLIGCGIKATKFYGYLISQIVPFYKSSYDERDEFEKDIWDFRKIAVARFSTDRSHYLLHFECIPAQFRNMVKQYLKMRVSKCSHAQCCRDVKTIRLF